MSLAKKLFPGPSHTLQLCKSADWWSRRWVREPGN